MTKLALVFIQILLFSALHAQISLDNPSFEGEPEDATMPNGWLECKQGTTPDILPGSWGVSMEASDGETYMGLITRSDRTWESIGQRLLSPLQKGMCYNMSVDLAHSKIYSSHVKPLKLRIWAGNSKCSRRQLLWESDLINHAEWETYNFTFDTQSTHYYIIFEACFPGGRAIQYKGNILVDNVSLIRPCKRA